MKVVIIVFSPSGHTLKVAEIIKKRCEEKNAVAKLMNITGKRDLLFGNRKKENLEKQLGEWDLLFIGGPIYAGHMERNVLNTIKVLPEPDDKHSDLAIPFATYGGVHSFIALDEMGRYLKRKNYKSILGIKIAAKHTLTTTLSKIINPDRPGKFEEKIISQAMDRAFKIFEMGRERAIDQSKSFKYCPVKWRIILRLLTQEKFHGKYKKVKINQEKCIKCKKCTTVCPVDMFHFVDGKVVMEQDNTRCILCAECFHSCSAGAIEYPYIKKARKRLKDGYAKLEDEQSTIYTRMRSNRK